MKRKLTIDWDAVHDAFVFRSEEMHAVLDLETGQVRYWVESSLGAEGSDSLDPEEIDKNPDRYVDIEPPESHDSFEWMEQFADGVKNGKARDALFRALEGRKPFRRFKDALADYPDLLEGWHAFEEDRIFECMADWAGSLDAEIVNPPAWLKNNSQSEEPEEDSRSSTSREPGRKLTWQDVCPVCRKYKGRDRSSDDRPLTGKSGLTEVDLCRLNREDQEDSDEDFKCRAFEPVKRH